MFYCESCKSKIPCSAYNWGIECEEEIKIKENDNNIKKMVIP